MPDRTLLPPPILCPMCGDPGSPDAVFCGHCGKALGDFGYIGEEHRHPAGWHETLADKVTGFVGKPRFLVTHIAWIGFWFVANTGVLVMVHRFDAYPFSLLGILLAIEAIFLSGFVLISQNRQNAYAEQSSRLDYEVNVRTYRELKQVSATLGEVSKRLRVLEQSAAAEGTNQ